MKTNQLAVLIPGAGYHCDKPLLYYSGKLAACLGYEVKKVTYTGLPTGIKDEPAKMQQTFQMAVDQLTEQMVQFHADQYDRIIFISKSVGTCAGVYYEQTHPGNYRHILLTPLRDTLTHGSVRGIAFSGTADPWVKPEEIKSLCAEEEIPLYSYEGANHSLETGDVKTDLAAMSEIMKIVEAYLKES